MKMKFMIPLALGLLMLGSLAVPVAVTAVNTTVAVSFDFGNGIVAWTDVTLTPGMNALNATMTAAAQLGYSISAPGGFVNSINGYAAQPWPNEWWGFFLWNSTNHVWDMASTGAESVAANSVTAISWHYAVSWPQAPSLATPDNKYPWASARHDSLNSGSQPEFVPNNITAKWSKDLGNGAIDAPIAVVGGFEYVITGGQLNMTTYLYDTNASIFCLNSAGDVVWHKDIGKGYQIAAPLVYGNMVIAPSADGKVYAFNWTDGLPLWTFDTHSGGVYGVTSSPIGYRDDIIVAASNGKLYKLHDNGTQVWNLTVAPLIYSSSPAIRNETIYIGADDGKLHAYDENGTTEIFSTQVGGRIRGSPLLLSDMIIVSYINLTGSSATSGGLAALGYDGHLLWQRTTNITSASPCLTAGGIASVTPTALWMVGTDGHIEWTLPTGATFGGAAASSTGNVTFLVANLAAAKLMAVGNNGQIYLEQTLSPAQYALSAPVISDRVLYVTSDNGYVYAFNLNTVSPTATCNATATNLIGHFRASSPPGRS